MRTLPPSGAPRAPDSHLRARGGEQPRRARFVSGPLPPMSPPPPSAVPSYVAGPPAIDTERGCPAEYQRGFYIGGLAVFMVGSIVAGFAQSFGQSARACKQVERSQTPFQRIKLAHIAFLLVD